MNTMTTDSPATALTTVDPQTPTTEAPPLGPADQPRRPATSRGVSAWTATIATLGVGAVLAVTAFAQDHTYAPAINSGAGEATELDERGIPTWWTNAPAANSATRETTELDERGIPTWWTNVPAIDFA